MAEDDLDFAEAMQGVKRLKADKVALRPPQVAKPKQPLSRLSAEAFTAFKSSSPATGLKTNQAAMQNEHGTQRLFFLRAGQQKKVLSRLMQAKFSGFDAQLDLHGMRQARAEQALQQFIEGSAQQGLRYLLIVHGKGQHSDGRAVLKDICAAQLPQHAAVLAFCSARQVDGGTGALYVQLSKAANA